MGASLPAACDRQSRKARQSHRKDLRVIGRTLGHYEVLSKLGEGGMGEVYRARDTRLNRDVAVKVVPEAMSRDADRLRRLQSEAQLLASLNHPQIATIHGLEEADGRYGLVMELVEGDDLKQRLARGPIPIDEAISIARQITLALEAAHVRGIIHRDLKPANIKVRPDGGVKVLDFGLAKAVEPDAPARSPDDSPTITAAAMTVPGTVMGTAAYMSPEQARGYGTDKRSDIWAFGAVLYEMLTGRSAFPGPTVTDTLAAVLHRDPDWQALPAATPPGLRLLLRRCLEKDPTRRLHDIADARIELDDVGSGARDSTSIAVARSPARPVALAIAAIAIVAAGIAGWLLRPVPSPAEMRLEVSTPPTIDSTFAISPDGRQVVFVARPDTAAPLQLWVRSIDSVTARPLPGTERATSPFWSPDGRSVGFFADVKLKRVDLDGGSVQTLASGAAVALGASWAADGTILYADNPGGPIRKVSAQGGEPVDVTRVEAPQERGHRSPYWLPGGRRFLFYMSSAEIGGVYVGELEGGRKTRLLAADSSAIYTEPGYLVFRRGAQLLAQRFDASAATVRGDAFPIAEGLKGNLSLTATSGGTIAYRVAQIDRGQRQLLWVNRTGREVERVVYADTAALSPALSHDGRYVAVFRFAKGNMDLWSYDRKRGVWDRLTFDPGDDIMPLWSHDDKTMIYGAVRNASGVRAYRRVIAAAPETEELLIPGPGPAFYFPIDLSPDDQHLLLTGPTPGRNIDIWVASLAKGAQVTELVATAATEELPQFSPDGKWIAYQSDKTGTDEIYVRPFPGPGPDVRVSAAGGIQARWNPKGKELFYIAADDRMMAVPITLGPGATDIDVGKPEALFATDIGSTVRLKYRHQYAVTPDGQSFMLNSAITESTTAPIILILNWKPPAR